jgi:hypothetical protein
MLVGWSVFPHITSKTDYVAIPSRLGYGDLLVFWIQEFQNFSVKPDSDKSHSNQLSEKDVGRVFI